MSTAGRGRGLATDNAATEPTRFRAADPPSARCASARSRATTRTRRDGTKLSVYRHADPGACPGWPVREVPTALLDAQIAALLRGAAPNRESAARIGAALARSACGSRSARDRASRRAAAQPVGRTREPGRAQEHGRDRRRDQDRQGGSGAAGGLAGRRGRRRSAAGDRLALIAVRSLERDVGRRTPRARRRNVRSVGHRGYGRAGLAPDHQRRGDRRGREAGTRPRAPGLHRGHCGGRYWDIANESDLMADCRHAPRGVASGG